MGRCLLLAAAGAALSPLGSALKSLACSHNEAAILHCIANIRCKSATACKICGALPPPTCARVAVQVSSGLGAMVTLQVASSQCREFFHKQVAREAPRQVSDAVRARCGVAGERAC